MSTMAPLSFATTTSFAVIVVAVEVSRTGSDSSGNAAGSSSRATCAPFATGSML